MSEKRFKVIDDEFSKWIVDTTLKEDKHEGTLYTAYDMCHKLNELYEENEQLRQIMNDIVCATDETYAKNASVFKVTVVLDFEKYMEIRRCIE